MILTNPPFLHSPSTEESLHLLLDVSCVPYAQCYSVLCAGSCAVLAVGRHVQWLRRKRNMPGMIYVSEAVLVNVRKMPGGFLGASLSYICFVLAPFGNL